MAPQLQIGTLDVTQYLDVTAGDGMDPASPSYSDRVFAHSLLKEGATFALENVQQKELIFPVYFKAASKDALHALVQAVNQACQIPGQTISWQDDGASQVTTFDLLTGQVDIEYEFRRAQQFHLQAKVRLFTQPYGRKATVRSVASFAGSGPLITMPLASNVLGDVAALAKWTVNPGAFTGFAGAPYRYLAVSVLPTIGYQPILTASVMSSGGTTYVGASGAVASLYLQASGSLNSVVTVHIPTSLLYVGDTRLLAIMRNTATEFVSVQGGIPGNFPTVMLMPSDWQLLDLGIMRIPSSLAAATQIAPIINVQGGNTGAITALILLPENSTYFLRDAGPAANRTAGDTYIFDGTTGDSTIIASGANFRELITSYGRGIVPKLTGATPPMLAVLAMPQSGFGGPANQVLAANVSVLERTRYQF